MLELLVRNTRALGILAIVVAAATWSTDIAGIVDECVYCRTQRTAIGLAGILMVLPDPRRWWIRYAAVAICFLGASVAVDQLFLIIRAVNSGKMFNMLNLVMAGGALFALVGQALILFVPRKTAG